MYQSLGSSDYNSDSCDVLVVANNNKLYSCLIIDYRYADFPRSHVLYIPFVRATLI